MITQVEQTMTDVVGWATKKTSEGGRVQKVQGLLCPWADGMSRGGGLISGEINQFLGKHNVAFSSVEHDCTYPGTGYSASLYKLDQLRNMPGSASRNLVDSGSRSGVEGVRDCLLHGSILAGELCHVRNRHRYQKMRSRLLVNFLKGPHTSGINYTILPP